MTDLSDDAYLDDRPRQPAPRRRISYNPEEARGGDAYRKARRHSSFVRNLRFILPALVVIGVVVFWGSARFIPGDMASLIEVAGIDIDTNSVVMQKPHISGFEGTRRAYDVEAESATQNLDDAKVVTFKKIVGHFGLDDAGLATLNAGTGIYFGHKNLLRLIHGVTVETTSGYGATLMNAEIDINAGSLTSAAPLELRTAQGSIKANGIEVLERGKRVTFTGGVSVTYLPPAELVTETGEASAAANP